jgi:hypothetical protein
LAENSENGESPLVFLDSREREVMKLRFIEQWEYHEIAAAQAIPIGTVQWRVFNAKKNLAPNLKTRVDLWTRLPEITQADQVPRMYVPKPVLVVTTHFVDEIEARIDRDYDACRNSHERPFTHDELIEASSGADALFITPLDRLDSDFFKRAPASVNAIATYSVGVDHIDLQAATPETIISSIRKQSIYCHTEPS